MKLEECKKEIVEAFDAVLAAQQNLVNAVAKAVSAEDWGDADEDEFMAWLQIKATRAEKASDAIEPELG